MNKKSFIIILIIAAVCIGITLVISNQKKSEKSSASEQLFVPELKGKLDSIEKIVIQHSGVNPLTFIRSDKVWQLKEKSGYKAKFKALRELLTNISEAKLFEAKTKKEENYIQLGVEEVTQEKGSGSRIKIYGAEDKLLEDIIIGRYKINKGTYLRKAGEKQSWLSQSKIIVNSNFIEWLDKKIIDMPLDNIQSVSYEPKDGIQYTISRETNKQKFMVQYKEGESAPKNPRFAENLARLLGGLEFNDVSKREGNIPTKDIFSSRTYSTFDGLKITVNGSKQNKEKNNDISIDISTSEKAGSTELMEQKIKLEQSISGWIFTVPDHIFTKFNKTLGDIVELEEKPE